MSLPITEQLEALCDLDGSEYRLSDWEVEFIDRMAKQVSRPAPLSPMQERKISEIYDAAFIHGKRGRP